MRTAICSGSFDPITLGAFGHHPQSGGLLDRVCVCVVPNAEKRNQMFTPEEKLRLVQESVAGLPNVTAELWPGLLVDFARKHGASVLVRGARNSTDFDTEQQLALVNQSICPDLETVVLIAAPEYQYLSSTVAREMIRYGQPLEKYLPVEIVPTVQELMKKKQEEITYIKD